MPLTLLVVGESLVDITHLADGSEYVHPGGSPMNVAVGLARLGTAAVLATQLGLDTHGEYVRTHLRDSDVAVIELEPQHRTATASVLIDASGSPSYTFDLVWDPSELPVPAGHRLVHVGSIGAVLSPGADAVAGLVARARTAKVPVSFDPNIRPAITSDLDAVRQTVEVLTSHSWLVKLSDEDADLLAPKSDPLELLSRLAAAEPTALAVLSRGGDGLALMSGNAFVEVPAVAVAVADTIGAGDSLMAALLAAVATRDWIGRTSLSADELTHIGSFAARATALTVSRPGADPPWRHELPSPDVSVSSASQTGQTSWH